MARFSDLPEDVMIEIFSWLPADSLSRFRRVKKSWYTLISTLVKDPTFVKKHLKNSKKASLVFMRFKDVNLGSLTIYKRHKQRTTVPELRYERFLATTS
ncbi:Putative F-box protein [Morus notabilis]|uniref:Putative F-box protein n=1 Tax=Morus notabilis TaxID=981085 RepID=W9QZJ3_9ROSA|nr:Putative F-box protein [Morus notabilis]